MGWGVCVCVFKGRKTLRGGRLWLLHVLTGELPALRLPWRKITAADKSRRNKRNPIELAQNRVQEVGNVFTVFHPLLRVLNHGG